ncbi:MAG: TonB-dependent receptor [Bacteroidales bacterium]|nr:TonB-dependent receptor [Bacteroidales bacterium]
MKKLLLTGCFFLLFIGIRAQNNTLKGSIYDATTSEPIPYCNIYITTTKQGAFSDENGNFSMGRIPAGTQRVKIFCIGYDSLTEEITFHKDEIIRRKFHLKPSVTQIKGTTVTAERTAAITEVRAAMQYVAPKQITQIPSIGGIPDLAQYLQVLPGVVSTGDQGGQLYVRGGTPLQNKVLLDGMTIYNPFHSIGLFSIFDTDILKDADIFSAGFNAEYGGRVSSVMDVRTRNGNRKELSGKVDLSTFGGKIMLEGPFRKTRSDNRSSVSFITSLKGSYLEQTSKLLYRYADENGLPYNYLDAYGKISVEANESSRINLFGFRFYDQVNYPEIARYQWNAWGMGSNFLVIPDNAYMIVDGTLAFSNYHMTLDEQTDFGRSSGIQDFSFTTNFSYLLGKNSFHYGIALTGTWVDYDFTNAFGVDCGQESFNSEIDVYVKYKWNLEKWIIEPGLRMSYYASQNALSPEPRIAAKYLLNNRLRLKMAGGCYSQNIIGATSDQDVVNLFYGFLTVPEQLNLSGKNIKNSLQKGQHLVAGMEIDITDYLIANVEAYFKNFSQLTNINRYQMFESDDEFMLEIGKSYGGDLSLKYDHQNLYVWAAYSLNWVRRNDGKITYRTHFDRRHNLNITATYRWGLNNCWEASMRWNYGSGFPFTLTKALYPSMNNITDLSNDLITSNENLGILLDDLNTGQMPDYHRLDVNMKRTFILSEKMRSEVGFGVTNLYNYANIFYVSRKTNEKIYQLPFLWSLHWSLKF